MGDSMWIVADHWRRRRRFAAQMKSADPQIERARQYLIDFARVGTRRTQRANSCFGQQSHPAELASIRQHREEPGFAASIHDTAGSWDAGAPHIRTSEYLLNHAHLRWNRAHP